MKIIVVFLFLINTTIDGRSIGHSEREELTSTTLRNYRQMGNVVAIRRNLSRISMPNIPADVEWIQSTTPQNEQQIIGSPVGTVVDLIFAVSSFSFSQSIPNQSNELFKFRRWRKATKNCYRLNFICLQIPIGILQTVSNLVRRISTGGRW